MSTKGPWTAQEIQFKDQLAYMAKQPENYECADCTAKAPKWAAFNHGIFICIKCSGCHRNIGRAISKVKSINLDRWLPEQFEQMCGNDIANRILLAHAPADFQKLDENDDSRREKFIEKKYVKRLWAATPEEEMQIRGGTFVSGAPVMQYVYQQQPVVVQQPYIYQQHVQQIYQVAYQYPVQPIMPPPQMNIPNYQVPKVEDDLLDFFGTPTLQSTPASVSQPISHALPPPQQQQPQPQVGFTAPVIVKPQAQNTTDDIIDLFNQAAVAKPQQAQAQQKPKQQSNKFDVSSFISNGQRNTYKPSGFDW